MIRIYSKDKHSPRLQYICHILFGLLLEESFQLHDHEELVSTLNESKADIKICYGSIAENCICIPDEGLLFENNIRIALPDFKKENNIVALSFSNSPPSGYSCTFDLFSTVFYILTEYYYYQVPKTDEHSRYDEMNYPLFKGGYHQRPMIHEYANLLKGLFQQNSYSVQPVSRKFQYTVSFDIDSPYLFKYKPFAIRIGGIAKDLMQGRLKQLATRLKAIIGGHDPYDVFDYIHQSIEKNRLLYFFLIDRNSAHDERHTYQNKQYRTLIQNISKQGIRCGLHPSYTAYNDYNRIAFEKQKLSGIIPDSPISCVRMHYLKYSLPHTYRYLIKAGFTDDYTSCPIHSTGFRTGMAIPYPWFDVEANQITRLTIHPTMIMDRSLQKYQGQNIEEAIESIKSMAAICKEVEGNFVILLHNNTLSEYAEWQGWRLVFEQSIKYLNQLSNSNESQAFK